MKSPSYYRARLRCLQNQINNEPNLTSGNVKTMRWLIAAYTAAIPDAEDKFAALAARSQPRPVVCEAPRCPRNGDPFVRQRSDQRTCSSACRARLSRRNKLVRKTSDRRCKARKNSQVNDLRTDVATTPTDVPKRDGGTPGQAVRDKATPAAEVRSHHPVSYSAENSPAGAP